MNTKRKIHRTSLHRAARGNRRSLAAMTLIEIMIVVVIIGMIATAVGVAVFPA